MKSNLSNLQDLIAHQLLFVTGKGGVGKTTLSFVLGLLAAKQGKRVLIVELNASSLSVLVKGRKIGYQPEKILSNYSNLHVINVDPHSAFEEYILMQIKFKSLYKAVFENKFVRYFIDATPGLADLMCIGKIYSLVKEYDLVIVDAPATGHGLALLTIPHIVSSAVKVGPLGHEAQRIDELLHDEQKTEIVLVTIPEDMPVTETVELAEKLKSQNLKVGPLFLNQAREFVLTENDERLIQKSNLSEDLKGLVHLESVREDLLKYYRNILKDTFPDQINMPFMYSENFGLAELEMIAEDVGKQIG
ncbi:MAG: ArsA family ATPase [Deltaproteobacteria bacterium]|nr:MAG: ArsA family ATPase [Deltaproteobacteria bacterium]